MIRVRAWSDGVMEYWDEKRGLRGNFGLYITPVLQYSKEVTLTR
jgi:hypothetical protein